MRKLIVAALALVMLAVFFAGCTWPGDNQSPNASISVSPSGVINTGVTVTLDGSGSSDPDGSIENYTWELGDGSMAYGKTVTKSYNTGGVKSVKLKIIDNKDATAEATTAVTVNALPTVEVEMTPMANGYSEFPGEKFYEAGQNIKFDASGTIDPDSSNLTYYWKFGDSESSQLMVAQHMYLNGGVYNVTLSVSDGFGNVSWSGVLKIQDVFFDQFSFSNWKDNNGLRYVNFTSKLMNNGTYDKMNGTVIVILETFGAGGSKIGEKNTTNPKKIAAGSTLNQPIEIHDVAMSISADTIVKASLYWGGILMDQEITVIPPP